MALILVIEDNPEIRENATEMLELDGHTVLAASHGREGLDLARRHIPDIILCDIMMPVMNGYQVLSAIRSDHSTSHIAFIFVTAQSEKSQREEGLRMGADEYLHKPFEMEELLQAVDHLLNR